MSRIGTFVMGVAVGCGVTFGGLRYHVVRTSNGVEVVPKLVMSLQDTYLDVRDYSSSDWAEHKQVLAAFVQAGKQDVIHNEATHSLTEGMNGMMEGLGISKGDS